VTQWLNALVSKNKSKVDKNNALISKNKVQQGRQEQGRQEPVQ
jgi:hypothetical protein